VTFTTPPLRQYIGRRDGLLRGEAEVETTKLRALQCTSSDGNRPLRKGMVVGEKSKKCLKCGHILTPMVMWGFLARTGLNSDLGFAWCF
jgi:hypothetical protein